MAERFLIMTMTAIVVLLLACSSDGPDSRARTATSPQVETPSPAPPLTLAELEEREALVFGPFGEHRTGLSFCFDAADELDLTDVNDLLARARDSVIANLGSDAWYFSSMLEAPIAEGCPPSTVPLGSNMVSRSAASNFHRRVPVANEHRVFVYFLSEENYASTFGDALSFEATAEVCCMTGNDAESSTAVYVTPAITSAKLGEAIMHAIGFRSYCAPGEVCPTTGPT